MIKKYISLIVWGVTPFVAAQEKKIDTVFISDKKLNESVHFQKVINLSDNIHKNTSNLSETLRFSTPLYIKENGRGMVSSPSFRGTTAQQTAFIWNGININSLFLGQGDINNIGNGEELKKTATILSNIAQNFNIYIGTTLQLAETQTDPINLSVNDMAVSRTVK